MAVTLTYSNDTYLLEVAMSSAPVSVVVSQARDAYQLAVAEGFVGTRAEWLASLQGEPGPAGDDGADGATGPAGDPGLVAVVLTQAEYAALTPEQQADAGKWYVIPSTV